MGHSLRVKGKQIVDIDALPQKQDRIIDGQGGLIIPGLINAHDHLELNTFKRIKYRELYTHSRQWIEDIELRFEYDPDLIEPRRQPLSDRLLVGAMKNLLSGVTTVCHHNQLHKPLRRNYPIRVVKNYGFCHSLFRGDDVLASYQNTKRTDPWMIHLAEGVDAEAKAEFEQLTQLGIIQKNSILVHGVGLTPNQRRHLIDYGGGLIWCPGSNQFLFGQTANVRELAEAGKIALGSDSRLSGEFDLLTELRVANEVKQLSPQRLFQLVTGYAARLLRLKTKGLGKIVKNGVADLVLAPTPTKTDYYCHLVNLTRSQIELVMLAGKPLLGSPQMQSVFEATRTRFTPVRVDQVEKLIPLELTARLKRSSVPEPGLIVV
jgi:cytosine/adenosine deaminase-related metal-dependent hydrolase